MPAVRVHSDGVHGAGARHAAVRHEALDADRLSVEIADPAQPSTAELAAVAANCRRHNLCLYRTDPHAADADALSRLASALGLVRRDHSLDADARGVAAIRTDPARASQGFIPYSTRALNWHTDGYYRSPAAPVRAVLMHCAVPAAHGGETELLDPQAVHDALQHVDPRFTRALSRDDAFTIPAREDARGEARAAVTGPVFSVARAGGPVHMRYTARTRSIEWCRAPEVLEARDALRETIEDAPGGRLRIRLAAGEGVICNNVLHRREGYRDAAHDGAGRLLYRIRALDRVRGS